MAQPTNKGIVKAWSLVSFAKEFGPKMQVGKFINGETGDPFHSCIFTKGDARTFAAFSSKMGELTPKEIKERKDTLQVVQLTSGNYCLCPVGADAWEVVDLGL